MPFGSVSLAMKTPMTLVAEHEGTLVKEKQLQQQKWGIRGKKAVNCNEGPNQLP